MTYNDFSQIYKCNTPEGIIYYSTAKDLLEVFNASEEDIELAYRETLWVDIREKRTKLLQECDWWCLSDRSPSTEQLDYRQNLRDITNQQDPENIIWPTKPE